KADSSLVSFTMSDRNGHFEFSNIAAGEYRLLVTHVNYHNSVQFFKIDDTHRSAELSRIIMNDKNRVLDEVVVTSEAPPVTLVGDTIQYNAGSFKTQPNANVEDLLKKLPGIKVDKDGTVKAQGETVQKVLVDGKEFFGNDPKVATKNLPADAVDKVQVFDKLSDQAQLTGFDDGNSEKTINLKLKKDKKKGLFGKINAGGGDDGHYQGRFNVNSFKGARQMSVIGMGNNTNAEGFSFMDILNFTGAASQLKNGGGNINIRINDNDPLAGLLGANNTGINTTWGGGFNYNNIIGNKTDFQSNYLYSRYNPVKLTSLQRQYFLPDSSYSYNQNAYSNNLNNNHRLNLSADFQIDSFTSIKVTPSLSYQHTNNISRSDYGTYSEEGNKSNDGFSNTLADSKGYNFSNAILFRKKFRKRARTFSFNLQTNLDNSTGDGSLRSIINYYAALASPFRTDSIDQKNNTENDLKSYSMRAVYTEPLFRHSLLEFSAGNSSSKSTSSKTTYDYNNQSGKYDALNDQLTNNFENSYSYTNAGIRLRKQTSRYNYAAGFSMQQASLRGKVISGVKDTVITTRFNNILPTARFQYYFSKFKTLTVNYGTASNQPSVSQMQPVADVSDPLHILQGNVNLKQEYIHSLRMNMALINPFKNNNLFVFATMQQTQNKIINNTTLLAYGKDSTTYTNVNGVYNINGTISWGFPVHFLKGTMELASNITRSRNKQYTNTLTDIFLNTINTTSLGPSWRLDMNLSEKFGLALNAGMNFYKAHYSVQTGLNTQYTTQQYGAEINWQLPKSFYFATDFNYYVSNQYADGFNATIPLWNASISKQVLKFNRGEIKLSANDILNKNTGVTRSTTQNYIEDKRTNGLRRFFLLSFTYSLSKTGLSNPGSDGIRFIAK
ncbi:MAG: outer membrane beta-barrel protein, partial [Bacteroidetes bacterium]|nr:outer membrane beta-barrel protein [Bacteroidota bacterium]